MPWGRKVSQLAVASGELYAVGYTDLSHGNDSYEVRSLRLLSGHP